MPILTYRITFLNYIFSRPPPQRILLPVIIFIYKEVIIMDFLKKYRKMISFRGLTEHTITAYSTYITAYLEYIDNKLHKYPSQVTYNDIRRFLDILQTERGLSDRTINCAIAQIRFFTMYVLHKPWDSTQVPTRRFDTYLPYVPSQEDANYFIESVSDLKQKAMLCLLYGSGLRIGEVCHLRYEDIQGKSRRIHICHGKNRSDRYAILPDRSLEILTKYWYDYGRPRGWLFPKQHNDDAPIDSFYLPRHIREHEDELGWEHKLTCHSFRHAFGTHLYENGTDILVIKELMGHKSLTSTIIYVHLAKRLSHLP